MTTGISSQNRAHPGQIDLASTADEHANLLESIARLDGAPAELRQTSALLNALEKELGERVKKLEVLVKKRKSEAKDVESLQNSKTKRFFVRVRHGGKEGLTKRLEKEEKEYIQAAQEEYNENQAIESLREGVRGEGEKKTALEVKVAQREEYIRRLAQIYSSVFSGPSPDFPEEDAAEDALADAQRHFDGIQATYNHEQQVLQLINQALQFALAATQALQSASRSATFDSFGVGGIWAELAERDDLLRAQKAANQANMFYEQARRFSPNVRYIRPGEVVQPEWLNVVFDNIFTDLMFQQKIQQSIQSMIVYLRSLESEIGFTQARIASLEVPAREAAEFLKSRRRELNAIRREILTRIAEEAREGRTQFSLSGPTSGAGGDELPSYMRFDALAGRVAVREGVPTIVSPSGESDETATPAPSYESVVRSSMDEPERDATAGIGGFRSPNGPPPSGPLPASLSRSTSVAAVSSPVFTREGSSVSQLFRTGSLSVNTRTTSSSSSTFTMRSPGAAESAAHKLDIATGSTSTSGTAPSFPIPMHEEASSSSTSSIASTSTVSNNPDVQRDRAAHDEAQAELQHEGLNGSFAPPPGPPPPSNPRLGIADPDLSRFEPLQPTPATAATTSLIPTSVSQADPGRPDPCRTPSPRFASNNPFRDV